MAILGPSPSYEYPFNQLLYVAIHVAEQVRGVNRDILVAEQEGGHDSGVLADVMSE